MGSGRLSPSESRGAAVSAAASGLVAVEDALQELEQALADGGDPRAEPGAEAGGWSEAEWRLAEPCVGLVKAARACLKKVLAALKAPRGPGAGGAAPGQLEELAGAARDVSPSVDELVLGIYPPVNPLTLRLNAGKLASVLKKILEVARASHVCAASEENWMQFLAGAVDHNMDKIKGFTQGVL